MKFQRETCDLLNTIFKRFSEEYDSENFMAKTSFLKFLNYYQNMTVEEGEIDKLMHIYQNKDNLVTRDQDIPLSWDFNELLEYLNSDGNDILKSRLSKT